MAQAVASPIDLDSGQGVIAGANAVLVDFHPHPESALCDGPQALLASELPRFLEDLRIVREAYQARLRNAAPRLDTRER